MKPEIHRPSKSRKFCLSNRRKRHQSLSKRAFSQHLLLPPVWSQQVSEGRRFLLQAGEYLLCVVLNPKRIKVQSEWKTKSDTILLAKRLYVFILWMNGWTNGHTDGESSFLTWIKDPSSPSCVFRCLPAEDVALLDSLLVVLCSVGWSGSDLMETLRCSVFGFWFWFVAGCISRPPCDLCLVIVFSSWSPRSLLLEDEAPQVFKTFFCSVEMCVLSCATWLADGCSSKQSISSDIIDSSSFICISSSSPFLFLLSGSTWEVSETLSDRAADRPINRSADDPGGVWDLAAGGRTEDTASDRSVSCMLMDESSISLFGSDITGGSSSSKGLDERRKHKFL